MHLGSLTTALASFCHIKSLDGTWLLRIEDTDTERCDRQFTEQILIDLEVLGLHWDGDVIYQSERIDIYNDYLSSALRPLTYGCECSRKDLEQYWAKEEQANSLDKANPLQPNRTHYPRRCVAKELDRQQHKLRIQLPDYSIGFNDGIQGLQWDNPQQTLGDMVARRQDGMINYILAASLDDGLQQVTHIMRGLDILPMTTAQISIMHAARLPAIDHWYHLPLICHPDGQKLSKQNLAQPLIRAIQASSSPLLYNYYSNQPLRETLPPICSSKQSLNGTTRRYKANSSFISPNLITLTDKNQKTPLYERRFLV